MIDENSQIKKIQANNDFKKHTQNVVEMKKDLESIFRFYTIFIPGNAIFVQKIEDNQTEP